MGLRRRSRAAVMILAVFASLVSGMDDHDHDDDHDHSDDMDMSDMDMASGMMDNTILDCLPDTAVCIDGYYPLYKTEMLANMASPQGASHEHALDDGYVTYMPNGATDMQMPGRGSSLACPEGSVDASGVASLPETAFCAMGYYPMYKTQQLSDMASPDGSSHTHEYGVFTLFMPDGVDMVHNMDGSCDEGHEDLSSYLGTDGGYIAPPAPPPPDQGPMGLIFIIMVAVGVFIGFVFAVYFGCCKRPPPAKTIDERASKAAQIA